MGCALNEVKNFFVTGSSGVGKTTLIKECVYPFKDYIEGFLTEEIRGESEREGFELKTLSGEKGILASKKIKGTAKLNKYGVDLDVLDRLGVESINKAVREKKIILIDEIGTMEMMSPLFCQIIADVLSGPLPVLGTIRLKAEPYTSQIQKMSETALYSLDRSNYPDIKTKVRAWLEKRCLPS